MKLKPKHKLVEHLSEIDDPRIERSQRHKLIDILTIAILAVICGADSWVGMESFGQAKLKWLKRILELPNGIPSHDTFARVFDRLNPEQLQQCFLEWVRSLVRLTNGQVIAIDGKTLRQSYPTTLVMPKEPIRRQRHWRVTTGATPATPPIACCHVSRDRISKQALIRLSASGECRRHYAIAFSQAGVVAVVPAKMTVI